jgi:hypothetical protein
MNNIASKITDPGTSSAKRTVGGVYKQIDNIWYGDIIKFLEMKENSMTEEDKKKKEQKEVRDMAIAIKELEMLEMWEAGYF